MTTETSKDIPVDKFFHRRILVPRKIVCAEDVFIGLDYVDVDKSYVTLKIFLLKVNVDKAEFNNLNKDETIVKTTNKIDLWLTTHTIIEGRMDLPNVAFDKLRNNGLRQGKITKKKKGKNEHLQNLLLLTIVAYGHCHNLK